MGLYYYGLQATSAAYSVVFLNLIPIVTFVIAVLVRYVRTYADKPKHVLLYLCLPSVNAFFIQSREGGAGEVAW